MHADDGEFGGFGGFVSGAVQFAWRIWEDLGGFVYSVLKANCSSLPILGNARACPLWTRCGITCP
jgi:hypothetical protein